MYRVGADSNCSSKEAFLSQDGSQPPSQDMISIKLHEDTEKRGTTRCLIGCLVVTYHILIATSRIGFWISLLVFILV